MSILSTNTLLNKILDYTRLAFNSIAVIRDADNPAQIAKVTAAGELKVSTPPPSAPPGTEAKKGGTTQVIPASGFNESGIRSESYTITDGKTLVIQQFNGGSACPDGVIRLGLDSDGDGNVDELLSTAYLAGDNNFAFALNYEILGDGTKAIIISAQNNDNNDHEFSYYWLGYEK